MSLLTTLSLHEGLDPVRVVGRAVLHPAGLQVDQVRGYMAAVLIHQSEDLDDTIHLESRNRAHD